MPWVILNDTRAGRSMNRRMLPLPSGYDSGHPSNTAESAPGAGMRRGPLRTPRLLRASGSLAPAMQVPAQNHGCPRLASPYCLLFRFLSRYVFGHAQPARLSDGVGGTLVRASHALPVAASPQAHRVRPDPDTTRRCRNLVELAPLPLPMTVPVPGEESSRASSALRRWSCREIASRASSALRRWGCREVANRESPGRFACSSEPGH